MICGALQTLNEEACEDVLEETEEHSSSQVLTVTSLMSTSSVGPQVPEQGQCQVPTQLSCSSSDFNDYGNISGNCDD